MGGTLNRKALRNTGEGSLSRCGQMFLVVVVFSQGQPSVLTRVLHTPPGAVWHTSTPACTLHHTHTASHTVVSDARKYCTHWTVLRSRLFQPYSGKVHPNFAQGIKIQGEKKKVRKYWEPAWPSGKASSVRFRFGPHLSSTVITGAWVQ